MKPDMVNVFIQNERKEALLIHNIGWKGNHDRWEFPGGKANPQEDLERKAMGEVLAELDVIVNLKGIFGDYETQTPEGYFLCRTFFGEIVYGNERICEKKHDSFLYADYGRLLNLKNRGVLVPNLVSALPDLKKYML